MTKKPVIGITLDWDDSSCYSTMHPWYALRCNYVSAFSKFSATPITLPHELDSITQYIEMIDGLVVTGGDYDLSPEVYGEEKQPQTRVIKNSRTTFEMKLIKAALEKNIPILAICAGHQLLAAIHGGKLLQDIKTAHPEAFEHEQKYLNIHMSEPSHAVEVVKGTLLHNITKKNEFLVNSSHHQAVKSVGKEMIISATSPDGIVEAVEIPQYKFVLGVEWHPEYLATKEDELIIKSFVESTKKR